MHRQGCRIPASVGIRKFTQFTNATFGGENSAERKACRNLGQGGFRSAADEEVICAEGNGWVALEGRRSEPYLRARSALLETIRVGGFLQGQPLKAAEIAQQLGLSPTPIREALAYLAGAGLIAEERGAGYRGVRLDADDLADLFHLQTVYLSAGLPDREPHAAATGADLAAAALEVAGLDDARERIGVQIRLFMNLVRLGESPALTCAYGRLCAQLAPFREAEAAVFRQEATSWSDLANHLQREDWRMTAAWLEAHGAERKTNASRILAVARSRAAANSIDISTL